MSGGQISLWDYGGGIDPDELEEYEECTLSYGVEAERTGVVDNVVDLGVRLSEEQLRRMEPGLIEDEDNQTQYRLRLMPEVESIKGRKIVFFQAEPTPENQKFDCKVWRIGGSPPYVVGLPRAWHIHNDQIRGVENPFYELEEGDEISVRHVFHGEQEHYVEIYTTDVFEEKFGYRAIKPAIFLLPTLEDRREDDAFLDLARPTPYSGQKFEIVPFNGMDERFVKEAKQQGNVSESKIRTEIDCDNAVFEAVRDASGVSPLEVPTLKIEWDVEAETTFHGGRAETIYEERDTRGARVILPEKGFFRVSTRISKKAIGLPQLYKWERTEASGLTWLGRWEGGRINRNKYLPFGDGFVGKFVEPVENENYHRVYVPTSSTGYLDTDVFVNWRPRSRY